MRSKGFLISLVFIVTIVIIVSFVLAQEGGDTYLPIMMTEEDCWPTDVPAGALPNQPPPVFCLIHNYGPDTAQPGANTWIDDFNHGLSFASFTNTPYRTFDNIGAWKTIFWRHADHWMVDLAPRPEDGGGYQYGQGYALFSPDQTFNFVNNKLVVETTVAAGMDAYGMEAWPEIIISTDDSPVHHSLGLYAFDLFPQGWTLGCRLQPSRVPICALKADDGNNNQSSTRIWEMSFFQVVGSSNFGGYPGNGLENYWRRCPYDEPDINCRDHFRLEIDRTSLKLYVNDHLYFAQTGIPPLPEDLLNGDIYVYLSSSQVGHDADTIRYHWDNFKVNPDLSSTTQNWKHFNE